MLDNDFNIHSAQGEPEFNLGHTLGRIEHAIVTMAGDIHEAVAAQKAIVERLEKNEQRLSGLEGWRGSVKRRNDLCGKIALALLLPFIGWAWSAGTHIVSLSNKLEVHEKLFPKYYKP